MWIEILNLSFKRLRRDVKYTLLASMCIVLASMFFAGIIIGSDTTAKYAMEKELSSIAVDIVLEPKSAFRSEVGRWLQEPLNSTSWLAAKEVTRTVKGVVDAEVVSWSHYYAKAKSPEEIRFMVAAIENCSRVWEGLEVVKGMPVLGANETYILQDSDTTHRIGLGDIISLEVWFVSLQPEFHIVTLPVNLTVVGIVRMSSEAVGRISSGKGNIISSTGYSTNLAIVSWEKTMSRLIDQIYKGIPYYNVVSTVILVYVDRKLLIDAWDIIGSYDRLNQLGYTISTINGNYGLIANNRLLCISYYDEMARKLINSSLATSVHVFFLSWYMAMTMCNVTVNLRRRETALFMTKGFTRYQCLAMFLIESIIIGLIGGFIAICLSTIFIPFFGNNVGVRIVEKPIIKLQTIFLTEFFAIAIALLAFFRPAKEASSMNIINALSDYIEERSYKKFGGIWAWSAFIIGSCEIASRVLGINLIPLPDIGPLPLIRPTIATILSLGGPMLLFWGFTRILASLSILLYEFISKVVGKYVGSVNNLVLLDLKRNPIRVAALVFLVAVVMSYTISILGTDASEDDRIRREIKLDIGADINIAVAPQINAWHALKLVESSPDVLSATVELSFSASGSLGRITRFIAIDPISWGETAFYEQDWFRGCNLKDALSAMVKDSHTIIVDRAFERNIKVGDSVSLILSKNRYELKVVGFFAPRTDQVYWSYVPHSLIDGVEDIILSVRILVKPINNDVQTVEKVCRALSGIGHVTSAEARFSEVAEDVEFSSVRKIRMIGTAIAVIAASAGVGLITLLGLNERKGEISLMSIRGMSYRQLLRFLSVEYIVMELLALILGFMAGWLILNINVVRYAVQSYSTVYQRIVFPTNTTIAFIVSVVLVTLFSMLPIACVAKRSMHRI